jgi:hypothetical protein
MRLFTLCIVFSALLQTGRADAALIFSDNFDTEPLGPNAVLSKWTIADGAVDVYGPGFLDPHPGHGRYIDLDGSMWNAATLVSPEFTLRLGVNYTLTFDTAGSPYGDTNNVYVSVGSIPLVFISAGPFGPFINNSYDFVGDGSTGSIVFNHTWGDNDGILLDNVVLTSDESEPVPEPASAILAGLGGLGTLVFARGRKGRSATQ